MYTLKIQLLNDSELLRNYYKKLESQNREHESIFLICPDDIQVNVYCIQKIFFGIACELVYNGNEKPRQYILLPTDHIINTPFSMANSIQIIQGKYRQEISTSVRCNLNEYLHGKIEKGSCLFQIVAFDGSPIRIQIVNKLSSESSSTSSSDEKMNE